MNKNIEPKGKLYVVATPIGNLDDISQRAKKILQTVNWIAAEDTRHSAGLLQHLGIHTELISYHEHNEKERTAQLITKLQQGEEGALISDAGTPLISDPGFTLVAAAHAVQIPVIPIPGPCAAIAALSASGLATDKFYFEGFLPAKSTARLKRLETLALIPHTLIFYEAPHRLLDLLADCEQVFSPQRQACVAREITKKFEAIQVGTLGKMLLAAQQGNIPLKGEFVVIVAGHQATLENKGEIEQEAKRILAVLLGHLSLKQAVQITRELTGMAKNILYDWAIQLQPK